MGRYTHELACGCRVVIALDIKSRRCRHWPRDCPGVSMLVRALAGTLGDPDRNGYDAHVPDSETDDAGRPGKEEQR